MPALDANVARFRFAASRLADDAFQLASFAGVEEISQLFRFELTLLADDPELPFADVVNEPATLTLLRGAESVPIQGIVAHLEQAGKVQDRYVYRAVLVPRLWRLGLTVQSRIFQNLSVPDILREVLDGGGLSGADVQFKITGTYQPRDYCVQYEETDLNFCMRLMEHEGLCFFFDHTDKDVLVISDDRAEHARIEDDTLPFRDGAGLNVEGDEFINQLVYREQVVTGATQVRDYQYATPTQFPSGQAAPNADMPGTHGEFAPNAANSNAAKHIAEVRGEMFEAQRRLLHGRSNSVALRSGFQFTLAEHYRTDLNDAQYLVLRVTHQGSQSEAMGGGSGGGSLGYSNTFVAIPATVQYRPPRVTPIPQVPGLSAAKLETAGGDYAYVDDEGRYKVKFAFDQGDATDGNASLPVRMAQPYAGTNYGLHLPNLAGTEVMVAFENGDLDRPVILGSVYNPSTKSPVAAKNKMQNVLRTAGGNEFILDDTKKKAQITLQSADQHRLFFDDDQDRIILESTNKHKVTLDDKNEHLEVRTKDGHQILMDDKNKKILVQSKDGHYVTIDDKNKKMVLSDKEGDNLFQIDIGENKLTIKSAKGDIELLAEKGVLDLKAKTINVESSADTTMKAANWKAEAKQNLDAKGTNVTAEAKMNFKQKGTNVTSEASAKHEIKGLQVKSQGSVQNEMAGAMAAVKASGITQIQGSLVKIN